MKGKQLGRHFLLLEMDVWPVSREKKSWVDMLIGHKKTSALCQNRLFFPSHKVLHWQVNKVLTICSQSSLRSSLSLVGMTGRPPSTAGLGSTVNSFTLNRGEKQNPTLVSHNYQMQEEKFTWITFGKAKCSSSHKDAKSTISTDRQKINPFPPVGIT